jgi:hypothetical protein
VLEGPVLKGTVLKGTALDGTVLEDTVLEGTLLAGGMLAGWKVSDGGGVPHAARPMTAPESAETTARQRTAIPVLIGRRLVTYLTLGICPFRCCDGRDRVFRRALFPAGTVMPDTGVHVG